MPLFCSRYLDLPMRKAQDDVTRRGNIRRMADDDNTLVELPRALDQQLGHIARRVFVQIAGRFVREDDRRG